MVSNNPGTYNDPRDPRDPREQYNAQQGTGGQNHAADPRRAQQQRAARKNVDPYISQQNAGQYAGYGKQQPTGKQQRIGQQQFEQQRRSAEAHEAELQRAQQRREAESVRAQLEREKIARQRRAEQMQARAREEARLKAEREKQAWREQAQQSQQRRRQRAQQQLQDQPWRSKFADLPQSHDEIQERHQAYEQAQRMHQQRARQQRAEHQQRLQQRQQNMASERARQEREHIQDQYIQGKYAQPRRTREPKRPEGQPLDERQQQAAIDERQMTVQQRQAAQRAQAQGVQGQQRQAAAAAKQAAAAQAAAQQQARAQAEAQARQQQQVQRAQEAHNRARQEQAALEQQYLQKVAQQRAQKQAAEEQRARALRDDLSELDIDQELEDLQFTEDEPGGFEPTELDAIEFDPAEAAVPNARPRTAEQAPPSAAVDASQYARSNYTSRQSQPVASGQPTQADFEEPTEYEEVDYSQEIPTPMPAYQMRQTPSSREQQTSLRESLLSRKFLIALIALIAVIALLVITNPFGCGSQPENKNTGSVAATTNTTQASLPTPIMSESSGLQMHSAVAMEDLTEILIHNASYAYANEITTQLTEATNTDIIAAHGTGRVASEQPTGDNWMTGEFIRCFRSGNAGPVMSAIDCGGPIGATVYAPVSGTVVLVKEYMLYNEIPDYRIHIQPDGRPDLDVVLIHLTDVMVKAGDKVVAGKTPIAKIRDVEQFLGDSMQLKQYTAVYDKGNHTHIQVNNANHPEYHGLDDLRQDASTEGDAQISS